MKDINLIRKIAWSFHHTTGLEWDDLFQEAAYAYLVALKYYDSSRSKLSTYMWWSVSSHLRNYLKKENEWREWLFPVEQVEEESYSMECLRDLLSERGRKVLEVLIEMPEKYDIQPQDALQEVAVELRKQDEQWTTIWLGIKELKRTV